MLSFCVAQSLLAPLSHRRVILRSSSDEVAEEEPEDVSKTMTMSTLSSRKKLANMKEPPKELLSEAWKDDEPVQLPLGALGAALGAILLFIGLAQVPIGSDAPSFTYDKGQRTMSPAEIGAKYKSILEQEEAAKAAAAEEASSSSSKEAS